MLRYRAEAAAQTAQDEDKTTEEDDDEEVVSFNEIDKLQNLGINAGDIQKLKTGVLTPTCLLKLTIAGMLYGRECTNENQEGIMQHQRS